MKLTREFGVSVKSLKELQIGAAIWWGRKHYTFPLIDGNRKIVGIRLRCGESRVSVPGSQNALFWPVGVKAESDELLFLPEGYSDTAAMRDMGFEAIGRPNCSAGLEHIKTAIGRFDKQVVLFADKDIAKERPDGSVFYPGIEGGRRLAKGLKSAVRSVRVIKPAIYKDVREWYRHGATKAMVMALVENARFA